MSVSSLASLLVVVMMLLHWAARFRCQVMGSWLLLERDWLGWLLSGNSCVTEEEGVLHRLVTPDSCHCGCVLVIAVMVCDLGRRDRQGSGGEGWEHVGGRKMDERWMKDWGSGRRGEGTAAVCHVVVVVSVWSWLSVLFRFFCIGHSTCGLQ